MASWPDSVDALAYIGEVRTEDESIVEESLQAATSYIAWRCDLEPPDLDYTTDNGDTIRPELREATLMLTSRLFRRRLSPEGVAGFGEFGAVRVTSVDADIERLITPSRSWGFA